MQFLSEPANSIEEAKGKTWLRLPLQVIIAGSVLIATRGVMVFEKRKKQVVRIRYIVPMQMEHKQARYTMSTIPRLSKIINIFYSYARDVNDDMRLVAKFRGHLIPLIQKGKVEAFNSDIHAGYDWHNQIDTFLEEADIIVLLISADFLASDYRREVEMKRALERHKAGSAHVLSVILRPFAWEWLQLDEDNLLPQNHKAVALWRNKDAAFLEIVRKIQKVIEELTERIGSVHPHPGSPTFPLRTIPNRHYPFFTGRDDILTKLHDYFTSNQSSHAVIQALNGLDGMGKTQIAIEYADRYQSEYQAIFWLRADSRELFNADIDKLADTLALPKKAHLDEASLFEAIRCWLEQTESWLLLIDNIAVEDFPFVDQIIPTQCSGHVLLTTHSSATGPIKAIKVCPWTEEEGATFLIRRAKITEEQATKEYAQAMAITRLYGGYPLAIDQAGAYIEETQCNFTRYLELYNTSKTQLLKTRGNFPDERSQSVTATLQLAFKKVARNPSAMELLRLFAFLHPDAIYEDMIRQIVPGTSILLQKIASDAFALDKAFIRLANFSLIQRHAETTTFSIHRIVQEVLKDKLSPEEQREWASRVVRIVNRAFPPVDFNTWSVCYRYLPQAQRCAEYITQWNFTFDEAAQLLHHLGRYCYERALYSDAEKHLTNALAIREQELGQEHFRTAESLNMLALLYRQKGDFRRAENFQQRSLAIQERVQGSNHPETATMLNNLALLYQEQGKFSLASSLYPRILAIYNQAYGSDSSETATALNNQALLYQEQKKFSLALPLYLRSLAIRESILEPEHPDIAESLSNLASLYQEQKNYIEAEPLLLRALQIYEKHLGDEHPTTASSLNNLAVLYDDQGKVQLAEMFYQRAITILESVTPENPDIAPILNNLALLYCTQEKYQQAEPLYLRALHINEYAFGPEHFATIVALNNLAEFYSFHNKYQQAEPLYQRILALVEHTPGSRHPNVAFIREKYAILLEHMQRTEEATILRQATQYINEKYNYGSSDETM